MLGIVSMLPNSLEEVWRQPIGCEKGVAHAKIKYTDPITGMMPSMRMMTFMTLNITIINVGTTILTVRIYVVMMKVTVIALWLHLRFALRRGCLDYSSLLRRTLTTYVLKWLYVSC